MSYTVGRNWKEMGQPHRSPFAIGLILSCGGVWLKGKEAGGTFVWEGTEMLTGLADGFGGAESIDSGADDSACVSGPFAAGVESTDGRLSGFVA
jgi:hypothetical protein